MVQLFSERDFAEFKKRYHGRHWTDRTGAMMSGVCMINKVKCDLGDGGEGDTEETAAGEERKYLTRRQRMERARQRRTVTQQPSLRDMPEFHPPTALLPQVHHPITIKLPVHGAECVLQSSQGNVGTPLKWIQDRVRECAFPSSLIKELGIHDLQRRKRYRRYGEVHFDYPEQVTCLPCAVSLVCVF